MPAPNIIHRYILVRLPAASLVPTDSIHITNWQRTSSLLQFTVRIRSISLTSAWDGLGTNAVTSTDSGRTTTGTSEFVELYGLTITAFSCAAHWITSIRPACRGLRFGYRKSRTNAMEIRGHLYLAGQTHASIQIQAGVGPSGAYRGNVQSAGSGKTNSSSPAVDARAFSRAYPRAVRP